MEYSVSLSFSLACYQLLLILIAFLNIQETFLMVETEEELMSLLMRVKEESEKPGLKLGIQKTKIIASSPITSWQTEGRMWKQ